MVAKKIKEIVEDITLEVAADIVEPTTADEFDKERWNNLEEINDVEDELKKSLNTIEITVHQLMEKMDDVNQSLTGLKHRIKVLETRVGVIH
tara:strand:+ start:1624 stop:1899 length:276 start_codon:yes stop_codon:yes gene_type:complete